jgi:hypothetical protein
VSTAPTGRLRLRQKGSTSPMQHGHGSFRLLGKVQKAEGIGAEGVHHRVQVNPANALEADSNSPGAELST